MADYLLTEVMERQSESVQRFLLRTSIVDRLTPELAVLLSDDPGAGSMLQQLERRGVFLIRVDGSSMYRYHSFFATLLRAILRQQDPAIHRTLHARAARWYVSHGMASDAEEHASEARDWDLLGELVERRWLDAVLMGREPPEVVDGAWAEAVPHAPRLAVAAAVAASGRGDRDAFARWWASASDDETEESAGRLVAELLRGRAFGTDAQARRSVTALQGPLADADPRLRDFAVLRGAELLLDAGDTAELRRSLVGLTARSGGGWTSDAAASLVALSLALEGRLRRSDALSSGVLQEGREDVATSVACLAAALVHAQRGQSAAAVTVAGGAAALVQSRSLSAVQRAVHAALAPGRSVGLDAPTAHHPAARLALVALGVVDVIDPSGAPIAIGGPAENGLRRGRHRLESHAYRGAIDALRPAFEVTSHPRTRIEAFVLAAIAANADHDQDGARHYLALALSQSASDQLWAPFLQHGALLVGLLESVVSRGDEGLADALALIDALHRMHSPAYAEALTQQEGTVLRFLPTMMSNAEIAERMHLSVNTVKTHLKAVYRKLGVERRRDAVVRARQLELFG
jgi:LuxR family maltose regulon positive regulatory protein